MINIIKFIKYILSYLVLILILLQSCEPYDIRLTFENETNDTLYVVMSESQNYMIDCFQCEYSNDKESRGYVRELLPKSSKKIQNFGKNSWPLYVEKACDNNMFVAIFHKKTIENYSWKKIYESKMESELKNYSLNDLNKIEWKIKIDN